MDLIEYCKKHGVIDVLEEFLEEIIEYYEQNKTFRDIDVQREVELGEVDDYIEKLIMMINDANKHFVNIYVYIDFEQDGEVVATSEEDVDVNLNISKLKVMKAFLEHFSQKPRPLGMGF